MRVDDVDVLSDVLRTVRLTGAVFFPMEVSSPWVDEVPDAGHFAQIVLPGAQHVVSYHIIRSGGCWASLPGHAPVRLEAGGKPIDTEIGHAAPLVVDWNGDGKRDLLVGQFGGGLLHVFLNEGTDAAPKLAAGTRFQAGGKDGTVPTG